MSRFHETTIRILSISSNGQNTIVDVEITYYLRDENGEEVDRTTRIKKFNLGEEDIV